MKKNFLSLTVAMLLSLAFAEAQDTGNNLQSASFAHKTIGQILEE